MIKILKRNAGEDVDGGRAEADYKAMDANR
jgi:hypothetical protein